jgi:uncharacterized phage-associated protein
MSNARDVAEYILMRTGEIPAMKLQKLVYYSQAWSLVWDNKPLFMDEIQAWANGPVVPNLYDCHRGEYSVHSGMFNGQPDAIDKDGGETIDAILDLYGDKAPHWLSELTHMEDPWKNARVGYPDGSRSQVTITQGAMAEYYSSL